MTEVYLGDGLYVSRVNGTSTVQLRAPRESGDHYVVLEPEILQSFINWLAGNCLITLTDQGG